MLNAYTTGIYATDRPRAVQRSFNLPFADRGLVAATVHVTRLFQLKIPNRLQTKLRNDTGDIDHCPAARETSVFP